MHHGHVIDKPERLIRLDIISTLSMKDKQDGCQQLMHPLTIAEVRVLLDVAKQDIPHHLPTKSETAHHTTPDMQKGNTH